MTTKARATTWSILGATFFGCRFLVFPIQNRVLRLGNVLNIRRGARAHPHRYRWVYDRGGDPLEGPQRESPQAAPPPSSLHYCDGAEATEATEATENGCSWRCARAARLVRAPPRSTVPSHQRTLTQGSHGPTKVDEERSLAATSPVAAPASGCAAAGTPGKALGTRPHAPPDGLCGLLADCYTYRRASGDTRPLGTLNSRPSGPEVSSWGA